jgi:helicase
MTLFVGSIGIDRHRDPTIRDLNGAKRDAVAIWALFVDSFPEAKSTLLVDESATLDAVKELLASTLDAAGNSDTVILNFAGHGTHDHRFVLHDTERSNLPGTTIDMADLARGFRESKAQTVICFLDCCFSGGAPARVLEDSPTPRDPLSPLQTISGTGRILVSASNQDEEALEDPVTRHGLFTNALITALQGDGPISLIKLVDAIAARVRADAARFGHVQTPVIFGHVEGQVTVPTLRKGPVYASHFPEFSDIQVSADFHSLIPYAIDPIVLDQWAAKYSSGLNELQLAAINDHQILDGESLLVVAPTSAGKTFIGELAAMRAAAEGKKAVFLLPYRALVNEKFQDFKFLYGDAAGLRVARCSGDWQDQIPAVLKGKYDIAFFTYETFLGLALTSSHILYQIGLVVVDEAQFISDPQRGISVELLLTYLLSARGRGINPQLVLLSAVIGGTNALDEWLGCRLLVSNTRPVPLTEGVINRYGTFQSLTPAGAVESSQLLQAQQIVQRRTEPSSQDLLVPLVRQLVQAGEKVLIFRNNRGSAQGCAKYLADELCLPPAEDVIDALPELDQSNRSRQLRECLAGGTAFHTSDLKVEERIAIETSFRGADGPVRVLVATSTVAAGVNTPASTVIIVETKFRDDEGERPYTVAEYKNMAGRAGRLGFREQGRSVLIADTSDEQALLFAHYVKQNPEPIKSSFQNRSPDTWLIRLLAQGPRVTKQQVVDLLANTYGGYLASRADPGWRVHITPQIQGPSHAYARQWSA